MAHACMIEPLERRQLLSSVADSSTWIVVDRPSWHLTGRGTLVISGTVWNDSISVERRGERIRFGAYSNEFPGNLVAESLSMARVKRVLVQTGDGNDRVRIAYDLLRRAVVEGGAGHDRIDGNAGAVLIGGGGNDRLFVPDAAPFYVDELDSTDPDMNDEAAISNWNAAAGPALLSGGAGDDVLVAAGRDSVVGGRGEDVAFQHILLRFDRQLDPLPDPRESFGERAVGVEDFSTAVERWPKLIVTFVPAGS